MHPLRLLCAFALTCCLAPPTFAARLQPDATLLDDDITYDVRPDASYTVDEIERWRIDTERGVKEHGQFSFAYSASQEDLQVLDAHTVTRDGRRIAVDPDRIVVQQSPQSVGAPTFDDGKVKVVIFPAVEVGVTLELHVRRDRKTALFPGQFSMLEVGWADLQIQSGRVTLRAPAAMALHVDAVDMPGGRIASDDPGRQAWQWTLHDTVPRAPEPAGIGPIDYSPRVAVTTFPSYEAAAAAYLERARPRAAVTPSVRRLADEITAGVSDRRSQAEAIYRWVSRNIRYVAVFLDFGSVVPHDAAAIADARYGDCKDHATLLEALLAAKGILAAPVLVNSGGSYWLPKVAAMPGDFDHAITYLPEFGLFVDSTAGVAMFGVLPSSEQGKQALVADDGSGQPRIVTLPAARPAADRVDIRTRLRAAADGTVTGTSEVSDAGAFDWATRQLFAGIPAGVEAQVVERILAMTGQNGTGSFTATDVHDLTKPFAYVTSFKLPGQARFPGPGALAVPRGFTSLSNIASATEPFAAEQRERAIVFAGRHVSESITLQLPEGTTVSALPPPLSLQTALGRYEAVYRNDQSLVTITRTLDIDLPGATVSPQDYRVLRGMALAIARDLGAQISYR